MAGSFPGLGFDPCPGDLRAYEALASYAGNAAAALAHGASVLERAEPGTWKGQAAQAFGTHVHDEVLPRARTAAQLVGDAATALRSWALALAEMQDEARSLERQAEACRAGLAAAVHTAGLPAGTVPPWPPGLPSAQAAKLTSASTALTALLARAAELEAQYLAASTATARRLADAPGMGAGLPAMLTSVTVSAGGGSSLIPARGTDPAAVHAWWAALTPAARKELIARYPAQIGWLDGLPAQVRNTANTAVLAADQQALQRQLDTRRTHAIPANQVAAIRAKLNAIKALNQALGLGPTFKADHVYLLGFDLNGNGHAIVSFGNPDTAQNVVTYVPGVGARLAGAYGDAVRAGRLYHQAAKSARGAKVASVYWLGYNAPQLSDAMLDPGQSLATPDLAIAGAPALDNFAAGLAAAHIGPPAHTVMLGHSYGSLVVGEAAVRAPGRLAQDLVFVGSPGVGVNNARQLGVGANHVWGGQAANDLIPDLPPTISLRQAEANPLSDFPIAAVQLYDGYKADVSGGWDHSHFGINPASPEFGGHDFYVAPGSPPDTNNIVNGLLGVPVPFSIPAHSQYWDVGSKSLYNLANIVDGKYKSVINAQPPTPPPGAPAPTPSQGSSPSPPAPGPQPQHPSSVPSPAP